MDFAVFSKTLPISAFVGFLLKSLHNLLFPITVITISHNHVLVNVCFIFPLAFTLLVIDAIMEPKIKRLSVSHHLKICNGSFLQRFVYNYVRGTCPFPSSHFLWFNGYLYMEATIQKLHTQFLAAAILLHRN